jgi:hypothetical protein
MPRPMERTLSAKKAAQVDRLPYQPPDPKLIEADRQYREREQAERNEFNRAPTGALREMVAKEEGLA